MEVSMKNTKQEIFKALQEAEQKIKDAQGIKYDPMAEIEAARKERQAQVAADIAGKGILSESIVQEYNAINQEIADKKKELSDLYGIEINLNTLLATMNANAAKTVELENEYDSRKARLEEEYAQKEAELKKSYADMEENAGEQYEENMAKLNKQLKAKETEVNEAIATLQKNYENEKRTLAVQRKRDEEEYKYQIDREHTKENDAWEDEKAAREKALADKENAARELLAEAEAKVEYISELEAKVAEIPKLVEEANISGINEGKATAGKEYAFEKRALTKDAEHSVALLQAKLDRAEEDLESALEKNATLQEKLDNAYEQMRELATRTVESSGGVKILRSEDGNK